MLKSILEKLNNAADWIVPIFPLVVFVPFVLNEIVIKLFGEKYPLFTTVCITLFTILNIVSLFVIGSAFNRLEVERKNKYAAFEENIKNRKSYD